MAPNPPAALVHYLRENRCVLFCGAGLSAWAGLPTWKKLLQDVVRQLADETPDDPNLDELRRLVVAGKLLEVADHCKETLGQRYYDILTEQLRGDKAEIPEPHKVIVQLPFSSVVTTNFDKLLERAYASVGPWPKTPTHQDVDTLGPLLFDGSFFILKAHGDIDRPRGMVLSTGGYQEIIHANPAYNSIFSALLLTKAILFVGYSLNDPDFRLLLDRQLTDFGSNIPARYALMTGIGKVESDVLWRTAKIRAIPYEDGKHEQVLEFLRSLLRQVISEPTEIKDADAIQGAQKTVAAIPADRIGHAEVRSNELSIGLTGKNVEATAFRGDHAVKGVGSAIDWPGIAKTITDALADRSKALLFGQELAHRLPEAVLNMLKDTPAGEAITLRLSPEIELLPWEWTIVDGQHLVLRNPLVRAPIGVSDAARGYPIVRQPARVLLIGDPNQSDEYGVAALPAALAEVQELASVYSKAFCRVLIGADASFDNVAKELSSGAYDVVHFAGHAAFDDLEPYLLLSQLVKLRASDLRSLISSHPPAILFLNSHYTIFVPPGVSATKPMRDETDPKTPALQGQRGFTEAASVAGVGTLVGTFCGVLDDTVAKQIGVDFHKELLQGTPAVLALHRAINSVEASDDLSQLTYAMSGYGNMTLPAK
jgi:hypothetical protein